jgi:tetratricopeptide (TPR) repeat protein
MTKSLDDELYVDLLVLCEDGDELVKGKQFDQALLKYEEAWNLLPEPKFEWEAATWILAAIGDAYFFAGKYDLSRTAFKNALKCPDGLENPFIYLRIGETSYELGDRQGAQDSLARAYMLDGRTVFSQEDPKYLLFLSQVMLPPPGQDSL